MLNWDHGSGFWKWKSYRRLRVWTARALPSFYIFIFLMQNNSDSWSMSPVSLCSNFVILTYSPFKLLITQIGEINIFADSILRQHISLRRKFSSFHHSTISSRPKKDFQSPRALVIKKGFPYLIKRMWSSFGNLYPYRWRYLASREIQTIIP